DYADEPGELSFYENEKGVHALALTHKETTGLETAGKLLLDIFLTKPWLAILVSAALSAGWVIIPMLIFYFHPKTRRWMNKTHSRFNDVKISINERSMKVPAQLGKVELDSIMDVHMFKHKRGKKIDLEVMLVLTEGKEKTFFISNLTPQDADEIAAFIMENV
ncbi:MAG: hypothetical protein ACLFR1_01180, partial [Spirochaetia bacterium]